MRKKRKPKPKYRILSLYWWNPMIYIIIIFHLPLQIIGGLYTGLKEWWEATVELITQYNWR